MPKTTFFQQVQDLAHAQKHLEGELATALHGARVYENIPWDVLAAKSGKARNTVRAIVEAEQAKQNTRQEPTVIQVDATHLSKEVLEMLAPHIIKNP